MAYTYNGDIVSSVLECGQAMYDKFIDENGNMHSGGTTSEGNYNVWNDVYTGMKKDDFYFYRYYGALKSASGGVDDYYILFAAFRTPFSVNDNIVRPFFMKPKNNFVIY